MLLLSRTYVRRQELIDKKFLSKHNMRVIDDNKRFSRMKPISYDFFKDPEDMDIIHGGSVNYMTEKLLTVEIPESNLEDIQEFEDRVFNNMKTYGTHHYHMFNTIMEQKETEKYLRRTNAAVQKAYEHYSLMLALANGGRWDAGY
jgi:hypothetical protein